MMRQPKRLSSVFNGRLAGQAWRDLKLAVRLLRRERTFAQLAIGTLALAIGAATMVVSIVEAEIWRPLPFVDADRLVAISNTTRQRPTWIRGFPGDEFSRFVDGQRRLEGLAGFQWTTFAIATGGAIAERVRVLPVTANFFATLGLHLASGRGFNVDDERPGRPPVAVLSRGFVARQFPNTTTIPATIRLDGRAYEVVGVAPDTPRLEFLSEPDLFVPIAIDRASNHLDVENQINTFGRMRRGESPASVEDELTTLLNGGPDRSVVARDLKEAYTGSTRRTFQFFLFGVAALLVIACVNVANLLLARGLARRNEFLIRTALGGSRTRLVQQLVIEGLVIALMAGVVGVVLSSIGTTVYAKLAPSDYLTRGTAIHLDTRVIAIASLISVLTALLFSVVPMRFAPTVVAGVVGHETRILGGDRRQRQARGILIAAQMVVAFLLLACAGILGNSFLRLKHVPLGFEPGGLLTFRTMLTGDRYREPSQLIDAYERVAERLAALPNISAITIASAVPLRGGDWMPVHMPGSIAPGDRGPEVSVHVIQSNYFEMFKIPRLVGRDLTRSDVEGAPRVAVVNRNLAARFFPGENAVGRTIDLLAGGVPSDLRPGRVEIVGVVENTKEVGIDEVPFDIVYLPFGQNPLSTMQVTLAGTARDEGRLDAIRSAMATVDSDIPVYGATTMAQAVDDATKLARFNLMFLGGFATLALVLAAVGIYGTTAYDTTRRAREFGLRMALGARSIHVLGAALTQPVRLGAVGLACGVLAAMFIARALGDSVYLVPRQHNGIIYQVPLADPLTLALAAGALIVLALGAAYLPARRAIRMSPMVALRGD